MTALSKHVNMVLNVHRNHKAYQVRYGGDCIKMGSRVSYFSVSFISVSGEVESQTQCL